MLKRAATDFPELEYFLVLAAATGARRSELVALRWNDVDLDGGTVSIARGVVFGPNGLLSSGSMAARSGRDHIVGVFRAT